MISHPYRILLGASLALLVGAAGAQNAPDNNSRVPAAKGAITTMPAQPSEQPTDKMAADPNATSQGTAAPKSDATQPAARTARISHLLVSRKPYRPRRKATVRRCANACRSATSRSATLVSTTRSFSANRTADTLRIAKKPRSCGVFYKRTCASGFRPGRPPRRSACRFDSRAPPARFLRAYSSRTVRTARSARAEAGRRAG